MTFASTHDRSEKVAFASTVIIHYQRHDLFVRVSHHFLACLRRVGCGCAGIEQTQEVIDFSNGSHGRTRVVSGGLLLDCDDRAETADGFHLGLLKDAHEVLGVGGKSVHIASLALCVDGVECQRGLAASAQACDYHELVAWYGQTRAFEVVRLRAGDFYVLLVLHL